MRTRIASRVAWSVGTLSIALMIGGLVLMFIDRRAALPVVSGLGSGGWNFANVLNVLVNIAATGFGIVLASRRPRNAIGWLFLSGGCFIGISGFGTSYALHALVVNPGSLPAGQAFAWASGWTGLIPVAALAFIFLLFPTGHLRSARWRPVAWLMGAAFALVTTSALVVSTMSWKDPFSPPSSTNSLFFLIFALPLIFGLAAALTAVIVRFRGSTGEERLQLKWFATGAAIVVSTLVASFVSSAPFVLVIQSLAFLFLFAAIAVAVLKYRLYEIDVVINKTLVYGLLAAFFTIVYVAVVVGIGTAIGSTRSPFLTLTAAGVIALAFNPVRERAKRLADRLVYGKRATPYEVLSEFSERMAGTYALDDILPRMARVLAEGTGGRSEIWLRVGEALRPVAAWPNESEPGSFSTELTVVGERLPEFAAASKATPVIHQGELLGAITVSKSPSDPLRPAEDKLIADVASQAGLVLSNVRLIEELRASRQRLVKAQDEERRRLERNIHDGAQQQLVALAVKQRLVASLVEKDSGKALEVLGALQRDTTEALENLRDLARGIYPPLLVDKGLAVALEAQARKSPVPVTVESDEIGRYPQEIEAAVYFCCLEALQNIAKYADASGALVRLSQTNGELSFEVEDDGRGFDANSTTYGTGLQGISDRLAALDGRMQVRSSPGFGTTLRGMIPASRS